MKYLEKLKEYPEAFEYYLGANNDEIQFAEKQLGLFFPNNFCQFLSECGMCHFGDTRIDGIFKTETKTVYPVVENTLKIRELVNLPNDLIVLYFEEQEYLTLYRATEKERVKDGVVFGAEVHYVENGKIKIGKLVKQFDTFEEFFEDFLVLGQ